MGNDVIARISSRSTSLSTRYIDINDCSTLEEYDFGLNFSGKMSIPSFMKFHLAVLDILNAYSHHGGVIIKSNYVISSRGA
jgi:hypothetical protein